MRDFRELKVWEKSHQLALEVYKMTAKFPKDELYGPTGQIRRACVSIPANIAEGCGRDGDAELARFLQIAMGSASELEYHLLLSHDLRLLISTEYKQLARDTTEVKRMPTSFIQTIRASTRSTKLSKHVILRSPPEADDKSAGGGWGGVPGRAGLPHLPRFLAEYILSAVEGLGMTSKD